MAVTTHYSERTFAIDLIGEAYKTSKPLEICAKAKEILDIDLSISEIRDYLDYAEDFEKASNSVEMREIFYEKTF